MSRTPRFRRLFDGQLPTVLAYVDQLPVNDDGCRIWNRSSPNGRYGQAYVNQRRVLVHKVVLERKLGRPLSEGEEACHTCDVGMCCHPDHLFVGTHADNMADMVAKGRQRNKPPRYSLAEAQQMREMYDAGMSMLEVGMVFGCTRQTARITMQRHGLHPMQEAA